MRRLIVRLLSWYRAVVRLTRGLRGLTDADVATRRVVSGQSWDEFCDTLKAAGAAVSGMGTPLDPLTQAEGYRYLTRLLRGGLEAFLEYNDPRAPTLRRMVHETVKLGADNPDNHYFNAAVSGAYTYRLRGERGTVHLLTFSTQKGGYGQGAGLPPTGFLDSTQLVLEADGSFEIMMSVAPQPKNWLPMQPETGLLIVRQTFHDQGRETLATLQLERLDADAQSERVAAAEAHTEGSAAPTPLDCARLDQGLLDTSKFVAGASMLFAKWAGDFQAHTNALPRFDPERSTAAGGDPNIAYYHSYWRLAEDEALIIEVMPPECVSWNFQLNDHFMESLDYRYFKIHLNKHTARYEADGSVRVVVAHRDPGLPNWLSTAGHGFGTMCWRWIRATNHPTPRCRVEKLNHLQARAAS